MKTIRRIAQSKLFGLLLQLLLTLFDRRAEPRWAKLENARDAIVALVTASLVAGSAQGGVIVAGDIFTVTGAST